MRKVRTRSDLLKAEETMSGAMTLERADISLFCCRNCQWFNFLAKPKQLPSSVNDYALVTKHPCIRFPGIEWKTVNELCGEFKERGKT